MADESKTIREALDGISNALEGEAAAQSQKVVEALDKLRKAVEDLKSDDEDSESAGGQAPKSKRLNRVVLDEFMPALVIGSGYGGAVAALRLGEEGIPTVVLERGKRWPITPAQDTFATFEAPDGRAAWLSDHTVWPVLPPVPIEKYVGNFETLQEKGITVFNGAGVGGGSLINNAILLQPRRELFERIFPKAISFDEMDQVYYPRVREVIKPGPIPDDILNTSYYESTRVNLEQYQRAGFPTRPVDLAIDWDIVREEIAGTKKASTIDGQSWGGLNSGAKKSVDRNYLAQAEATGHVEVLPLHVVVDIEAFDAVGGYLVSANQINEQGETVASRRFVCKFLFLAAGSVGTSKLLVRAKAKGTLPRLNKSVGQGWASNGDFVLVRGGLPITNAGQGGPGGNVIIEDLDNPFAPIGIVEAVIPKPAVGGLPPGSCFYITMGLPPAIGQFSFDSNTDSVTLNWPAGDPRLANLLSSAKHTVEILNQKNTDADSHPATLVLDSQGTGHPLGGASVGSACDWFGRVKRYPGLYVVDGALIPGSSGIVNPALTIAALAERSMEHVIDEDILP